MGPPKAKEKDISPRIFYSLFSPGFEPGTSRGGKKSISLASETTNQFFLPRTMNKEVFFTSAFQVSVV